LAGGRGVAKIAVFTTASGDPVDAGTYYVDMFTRVYGAASATYIPVTETSGNADDAAIAATVRGHTGVFFGGGDQLRITNALRPNGRDSLVLQAIRDVLRAGGTVGGTSAGAACQGLAVMITGGTSYRALTYGAYSGGPNNNNPSDLSFEENGGLGMLSGYVIDTHFSERGREGRLIRLLQDTRNRTSIGTTRGFGVDEDTALVVTNLFTRPTGRVVGTTGGVFFADVTNLVNYPSSTTDFERVSTTFLTHGDVIDLTTGAVTFASWKSSLAGNENFNNAVPSNDILSFKANGVWRSTAKRLFDNKIDNMIINDSHEKKPEFRVAFDKTSGVGYGGYLPSASNVFVVSYKDLRVDIRGFD